MSFRKLSASSQNADARTDAYTAHHLFTLLHGISRAVEATAFPWTLKRSKAIVSRSLTGEYAAVTSIGDKLPQTSRQGRYTNNILHLYESAGLHVSSQTPQSLYRKIATHVLAVSAYPSGSAAVWQNMQQHAAPLAAETESWTQLYNAYSAALLDALAQTLGLSDDSLVLDVSQTCSDYIVSQAECYLCLAHLLQKLCTISAAMCKEGSALASILLVILAGIEYELDDFAMRCALEAICVLVRK